MPQLLTDRVALVTGGCRGIGRAIVDCFAEHGSTGLAVDVGGAAATASLPSGYTAHLADVTVEEQVAAAFAEAKRRYGRLDIVVANAGIVPPWHETDGLDLAEWDRVFAVNARGVAATIKHAVPLMRAQGGAIVVTASVNALKPHARQLAYTATKHATVGIIRCAALDLGRFNIRVNGLAPGPIATAALRERVRFRATAGGPPEDAALRALAEETPLGRIATEREVAKAALFLASDLASAITGHLLPVDAGLSAC
ncbi:MAG TPA: SDR family oxidoreductase [Stellaceae bacterium]|nr:SDR family oxidoreductase [Stellaceae bacterium]